MSDQAVARKILSDLVKRDDLKNRICNDCPNPNPQWASLSFAVFICLQCAGTHRGFGVHISFVRSISMDTWQDEQIRRMQLGGNGPFREFMKAYTPVEQGGYNESLNVHEKYHCWAAAQYREKLDALLAGKEWSPSPPPDTFSPPGRPSSAQGLRKARTTNRSTPGTPLRSDSASPAQFTSANRTPDPAADQKSANEAYFATMGRLNDNRPADLPPSQGGRYQGFGNSPMPTEPSHPSYGISSRAAPTLTDLQENPRAALSKGWSLLSAVVVGASKVVNENIIQPGIEKASDPTLHASVMGCVSQAQTAAVTVGSQANQWSKSQLGVDVAGNVGNVVGNVKDRLGGPSRDGYGSLSADWEGETSALYHDDEDRDFDDFGREHTQVPVQGTPTATSFSPSGNTAGMTSRAAAKKANDWDDDWKDF